MLADKQLVQAAIADSYTELMPFRLAVLHAAWLIDERGEHAARTDIGALKVLTPKVLQSITLRAIQIHGGLGATEQLPLVDMLMTGIALGLADGTTDVHKMNLARGLLKGYKADDPMWPSQFLGRKIEAAQIKYGDLVDAVPTVPAGPPNGP